MSEKIFDLEHYAACAGWDAGDAGTVTVKASSPVTQPAAVSVLIL